MWEKFKNDKDTKSLLKKLIAVLIVASVALLLFDVLTQSNDGRRQIVDENGGSEYVPAEETVMSREEHRLQEILSGIKDVGKVDVMITYKGNGATATVFGDAEKKNTSDVEGVIVTAEGAGNIVVRNHIVSAVTAVFNISTSNVEVFEKQE